MVVLACVNNIDFDSKAMLYRNKDYSKALSKMKKLYLESLNEALSVETDQLDMKETFFREDEAYAKVAWTDGLYYEWFIIPLCD